MPDIALNSTYKRALAACAIVFFLAAPSFADSYLLYKEAQFVIGSQLKLPQTIYFSQTQEDVMQKPSIGMDYLYRFSDDSGDKAIVALQGRLAWNELDNKRKIEPQLYNAYIKFKNPFADLWLGHARTAYGMSSYFDSHALLLPALGMYDIGFDRDWGVGFLRDLSWGDIAISYTMGSGMPFYGASNHLSSGRVSYGVLNSDNYNVGISKVNGTLVQTMGYDVMPEMLYDIDLTGVDAAFLYENYELRAENSAGTRMNEPYYSSLIRGSIKLLEEENLRFELQQVAYMQADIANHIGSAGISYLFDQDIAFRLMYQYDELMDDIKVVAQVYYYAPW